MVLLPPEEALHGTLKDAESAVATAVHEEGYAVSRFRSKKSKLGEIRKVWLCCCHSRRAPLLDKKQRVGRQTETDRLTHSLLILPQYQQPPSTQAPRLASSPLSAHDRGPRRPTLPRSTPDQRSSRSVLRLRCAKSLQRVTIARVDQSWQVCVADGTHNHVAPDNVTVYPSARKRFNQVVATIREMTRAGATPRVIVSAVRQQNNDSLLLNRDVYNERMRARDEALDGREPLDERGRVTHLFFVFPVQDAPAPPRRHDGNEHDLLDRFCFMQAECEVDYIWAATRAKWCFDQARQPKVLIADRELALMSALELTFPSAATILCVWHIQKNVLSNVKQHFSRDSEFERFMGCWRDLISSKTVADFETSWSNMQMEFCAPAVGYLASTWFPHKEKFVEAWTRHEVHFGHVATSRVEGCHVFVKEWVSTSTGDLNDVVDRIHLALENQAREIAAGAAYDRANVVLRYRSTIWLCLTGRVSHHALKLVLAQLELAKPSVKDHATPIPSCAGVFSSTMGLPCMHRMATLVKEEGVINQTELNAQWWLKEPYLTPLGGMASEHSDFKAILAALEESHDSLNPPNQQILKKWVIELLDRPPPTIRDPDTTHPADDRLAIQARAENRARPSALNRLESESVANASKLGTTNKRARRHQLRERPWRHQWLLSQTHKMDFELPHFVL